MQTLGSGIATEIRTDDRRIELLLRLAKALHRYGVPAHRLEGMMARLSETLGTQGSVYSSPTAIFASFGEPSELRTAMIRVEPGETDLGRLVDLDRLASEVMERKRDARQGLERLDAILAAPPSYGPGFTLLCFTLVATGATVLLGGQLRELVASVLISGWLGLLLVLSKKRPGLDRVTEALGAFGAAAIAVTAARILGPFSTQTSIIAGLIPLLPGLTLTVAMTELAMRNLVSGTTRLTSAILVLLQLVFGVALGSQVDKLLPALPHLSADVPLPSWLLVPALVLATAATAVLFSAKPRDTPWIVLAGGVAYFGTRFGSLWLGPELGAFVGSVVLCTASNALARMRDKPALITIVPGLILLVPGSIGFRSLNAMLGNDPTVGVEIAFSMGLIAISLVTGLLVANVLVPPRKVL